MKNLTEIDLGGLGRFMEAPATFRCLRHTLPAKWDYVYTNTRALLRVQSDGAGSLQLDPPGGATVLNQPKGDGSPSWMTWIIPVDGEQTGAFTNFWLPHVPGGEPGAEPEEYGCEFSPEAARYRLVHAGLRVETELWVPPSDPVAIMSVTVANATQRARCVLELALKVKVSRIMIRQPQCLANSGAWTNGMPMTLTLGCGTWGGNISSSNITWEHMLNYTWISSPIPSTQPTDAELFGAIMKEG